MKHPGVFMLLFILSLTTMCFRGGQSTRFTVENRCPYTIWPATLAGADSPQLASTGFELQHGASTSLDIPSGWSGRVWARSLCSTDATGKFRCGTGDCSSGQITCNGAGGVPPASLVEFTLANHNNNDHDFYDISLVDGFNLPISVKPQGDSSNCKSISCHENLNANCPGQLALKGSRGSTIGCGSACVMFNQPEYCCTGDHSNPSTCPPTTYSNYFKKGCPQAYSYAFDDSSSTFTCTGGADYLITFCP